MDQTVENNGVEVKLSDVIIDKNELIFSAIVNTNKAVEGCSLNYDIFHKRQKTNPLRCHRYFWEYR